MPIQQIQLIEDVHLPLYIYSKVGLLLETEKQTILYVILEKLKNKKIDESKWDGQK